MAKIDLEGFDELNDLLEKMTLTDEDEKAALKEMLKPVKEEVQKNTPVGTGSLRNSIKTEFKKENNQNVGKVIMGEHYGRFLEYGTTKSQKHVGFFARSIRASKDAAMKVLRDEIFARLK